MVSSSLQDYASYLARYLGGHSVCALKEFPIPPTARDVVVAVPGFIQIGEAPYVFGFARQLERRGIYLTAPRIPPLQDLRRTAEQVSEFIGNIPDHVQRIVLLGDSMGGLISRYVVQTDDVRGRVNALICVSTPHYGTPVIDELVRWIPYGNDLVRRVPCLRQMIPGSDFLEDLNKDPDFGDTRVENLFGDSDALVPIESARFRNNGNGSRVNNRRVVKGASHLSILYHRRLYRLVRECFED
ncbi:MAG TPA: hypothetical protein VJA47_02965 [archaeon]|nr:hypothetical protein [archaeon]